ncbi:MAG TPA: alpha/beta fold hydrolase, partial [Ilumatobacteraceae bacterium]|nr:alpha/beta fold hydrolase [Ilumatobacteraceae bacterium]
MDPGRFELRRGGAVEHVEPQVFDVLVHLIRHRERVVTKTELLDTVWGDRFVSESALASRLKSARRAVGDDGSAQRIIRTVFGRGYQFVAPVLEHVPATSPSAPAPAPANDDTPDVTAEPALPVLHQAIRFCTAPDGARIAYATMGSGPVLVKAANWLTHLDHDRETFVWRHWLEGLANNRTLVRYDERGCGMSDWDVQSFDFDDWVDDLELVVDAAGLETFPLLGVSQGAAVAVAFAARHPERVTRLILCGAYGRGRLLRATTEEERREAALDLEVARVGWGRDDPSFRQMFTSQFLPDGTREQWQEFNELQRLTTSPANAVRFLETFAEIDVTDLAPKVDCPTLVMHSRDDLRVPLSSARDLASLIPGAQLVSLPSRNHIVLDEPAWPLFLAEIDRFLAAESATDPLRRTLSGRLSPVVRGSS